MAYTNLHPGEQANIARDSNIYYARVRGGLIERVGGQQVGSLDDPIDAGGGRSRLGRGSAGLDPRRRRGRSGNPVLVFASFPTVTDHRYHYARWTGSAWEVNEITAAGGSIADEPGTVAALLGRHHARPRGPVAGVPLAPGRRRRMAGGDADDRRQRRDLERSRRC